MPFQTSDDQALSVFIIVWGCLLGAVAWQRGSILMALHAVSVILAATFALWLGALEPTSGFIAYNNILRMQWLSLAHLVTGVPACTALVVHRICLPLVVLTALTLVLAWRFLKWATAWRRDVERHTSS